MRVSPLSVSLVVLTLATAAETRVAHAQTASPRGRPSSTDVRPVRAQPQPAIATRAQIDAWVRALGDPNIVRSEGAADRLAAQGPSVAAALMPALNDDDPQVRRLAAGVFARGVATVETVPALAAALDRTPRDGGGYTDALAALRQLGPDAGAGAAAAVGRFLDDPDTFNEQRAALETVGAMGPAGRAALPAVARKLVGRDIEGEATPTAAWTAVERQAAARALAALGGDNALELLRAEFLTPTGTQRDHVTAPIADGLVTFGLAGRRVLEAGLQSSNPGVRLQASRALGAVGVDAVPALTVALGDTRPCLSALNVADGCRIQAAESLAKIGPPASAALPALRRMLREAQQRRSQDAARRAIAAVSGGGSSTTPGGAAQ